MGRLYLPFLGCWFLLISSAAGAPGPGAGQPQPDSLQLHAAALPDSARLKLLGELSAAYGPRDLRLGLHYARQKFELAHRIGNVMGEVMAADDMAVCYARSGELPAALRYYLHELRLAQRHGYTVREALAYLGQAMVLAEEKHVTEAEACFRQALAAAGRSQGQKLIAYLQSEFSAFLLEQKRYAEAEPLLRTALASFRQMQQAKYEGQCLMHLTGLTTAQGRYAEALQLGQQALQTTLPRHDPYFIARTYNELSRASLGLDNTAQARHYAEQAMTQARASQNPDTEAETLGILISVAEREKAWDQAFRFQQRLTHLRDSVLTEARAAEVARLQTQYETEKKQQAIGHLTEKAQHQQAQMRWLMGGLLALALALTSLIVLASRLRYASRALRRSNAAKDRLLSIVGHDLRGPVAAFQQVGPMLRYYSRQPSPHELAELADEMETGAHRLAALLDNLLNWARAQMGEVVNRPEALALDEVVNHTVGLYRPTAVAKHLHLQSDLDTDVPPAWADPALLATVLRNLVSNAMKFSPAGSTIRLAVAHTDEGIEFSVTDNGVGMTPEQLEALFRPAVRPTRGTTGEEGTGLGVAVCRHFVELLGGRLQAASTTGVGTRFWFTIPAAAERVMAAFPVASLN